MSLSHSSCNLHCLNFHQRSRLNHHYLLETSIKTWLFLTISLLCRRTWRTNYMCWALKEEVEACDKLYTSVTRRIFVLLTNDNNMNQPGYKHNTRTWNAKLIGSKGICRLQEQTWRLGLRYKPCKMGVEIRISSVYWRIFSGPFLEHFLPLKLFFISFIYFKWRKKNTK